MSDSIVIIPTYNEKENIENIIRAVFGLEKEFHILIIDDGSPDGTADIVKRLHSEFPERLFMVERKGKLGLGTAYICGFKWAIEHKYDFVFEMDADFSHNPNDLPKLYAACTEQGGRCGYRFALQQWRECGELAAGTCIDVILRICLCPLRYRDESTGYDCRFQMLPSRGA